MKSRYSFEKEIFKLVLITVAQQSQHHQRPSQLPGVLRQSMGAVGSHRMRRRTECCAQASGI